IGDCTNGADTCCNHGCIDTQTDRLNCGGCGLACEQAKVCIAGRCQCPPTAPDYCSGYCTSNARDPYNCGNCNHRCQAPANAFVGCTAGQCTIQCYGGYLDCDGLYDDGCEIVPWSDPANCGACGNRCPMNQNCIQGKCK